MSPARLTAFRVWMARAYSNRQLAASARQRLRSAGCPSVARLRERCPDAGARIAQYDAAAARCYSAAALIRDGAAL